MRAPVSIATAALMGIVLSACPPLEALSPPDADAGADARLDAGSGNVEAEGAARDAGAGDAGARDALATDDGASDAAACEFVDVQQADGPKPGCPLSDGSTCAPGSVAPNAGYLTMAPPRAHAARCTAQQLADFESSCAGLNLNQPSCQSFMSQNANCAACLKPTAVTDPQLGPIVSSVFGGVEDLTTNAGGCVALLDPCKAACGQAMYAVVECQLVSCVPYCGSQTSNCFSEAFSCECSTYGPPAKACGDQLTFDQSPALACIGGSDQYGYVPAVLAAFCGP